MSNDHREPGELENLKEKAVKPQAGDDDTEKRAAVVIPPSRPRSTQEITPRQEKALRYLEQKSERSERLVTMQAQDSHTHTSPHAEGTGPAVVAQNPVPEAQQAQGMVGLVNRAPTVLHLTFPSA